MSAQVSSSTAESDDDKDSATSEDGFENGDFSHVEDPDIKDDDEYSTNVEDYTSVGELEDSSNGEYSSDGTTLLKPVLFIDMVSGEEPKIKKRIEYLLQFDDASSPWMIDRIDRVKLTGCGYADSCLITGPVLQVIGVHISNPTPKELKLYGHISITDDKRNTYYIYNRASESPENVSPGHRFLPISRYSILPLLSGSVEFHLKDCGDLVFERNVMVEYLSKYEDGYVRKLGIGGKDKCRATMFFTIIPYARFVEFSMEIMEPCPDLPGKPFKVHGRIKANDVVCFKKRPEEAIEMHHGGALNDIGGKSVLAVSVFQPLLLDLELFGDGTQFAFQACEVFFNNYRFREYKVACTNKKYVLGVAVQWISYQDYFDIEYRTTVCCQINNPTNHPTFVYENEKSGFEFPEFMPINLEPAAGPGASQDRSLVEVYSIFVGGGDSPDQPLDLCGTIVVRDGGGKFYIFFRNQYCPDKLSMSNKLQYSRTSVSLAWPCQCLVEEKLLMHFKLEDAHGNKICRGDFDWYERTKESSRLRRCAVIPGEKGYFTAVHFSVFNNGLQAKLTVEYSSEDGPNYNNDDRVSVYGSVLVEYSNYSYSSRYENEYYRSIIFKRSKENAVKVKNGTKIPLSKSMVSAPSNCEGIIVDFDLLVISSGEESRNGHAIGRIPFKAKKNDVCEMRAGAGCHIKMMVDWV